MEKTVVGPPMNFKTEQIYFDEHQQGEKLANEVDALGKVLKKTGELSRSCHARGSKRN